jgi:hypothetical protein
MNKPVSSTKEKIKNIFKREQKFTTTCKICNMEFSDSQRTKKHMIKAHTKPKRENI